MLEIGQQAPQFHFLHRQTYICMDMLEQLWDFLSLGPLFNLSFSEMKELIKMMSLEIKMKQELVDVFEY